MYYTLLIVDFIIKLQISILEMIYVKATVLELLNELLVIEEVAKRMPYT